MEIPYARHSATITLVLRRIRWKTAKELWPLYKVAANTTSNLLGDHEDTARSYHMLGIVQRDMGNLKGALESLQRAALMRSDLLGDHEDTAPSYFELGEVQCKAEYLKGALESVQLSLRFRKEL